MSAAGAVSGADRPAPSNGAGPAGSARRRPKGRSAAFAAFCAVEVLALPLIAWWGRGAWFTGDDWDYLATRSIGDVGDLVRPHYQHWTTLPIVAYRLIWSVVGLRGYVPYQLLAIVAHLTVAALLRAVMRRAGIGAWVSTAAATLFVFFGSGAENILVAFQITFVGALAFGLIHLLLADHDGPFDRRDWLGLLAGFAALLCSGVAIPMVVVVGSTVMLRRGRRIALSHTAPLAAAYVLWSLMSPEGQPAGIYRSTGAVDVIRFVGIGLRTTFSELGQVAGAGVALTLVLVAGLVLTASQRREHVPAGRVVAPIALLTGAIVFLLVTGFFRSGQSGLLVFFEGVGPERARQSRYLHVVAAMVLPAVALAADMIIRRWRQSAVAVFVLLLAGIPGNVKALGEYTAAGSPRAFILTAPRLPIADQLPRSLVVAPDLQIGWLIDNLGSGRIPEPGPGTPADIATYTLKLALAHSKGPAAPHCRTVAHEVVRVLEKGQSMTLKEGNAAIRLVPEVGAPSRPSLLVPGTVKALAGPLRISVTPYGGPIAWCY